MWWKDHKEVKVKLDRRLWLLLHSNKLLRGTAISEVFEDALLAYFDLDAKDFKEPLPETVADSSPGLFLQDNQVRDSTRQLPRRRSLRGTWVQVKCRVCSEAFDSPALPDGRARYVRCKEHRGQAAPQTMTCPHCHEEFPRGGRSRTVASSWDPSIRYARLCPKCYHSRLEDQKAGRLPSVPLYRVIQGVATPRPDRRQRPHAAPAAVRTWVWQCTCGASKQFTLANPAPAWASRSRHILRGCSPDAVTPVHPVIVEAKERPSEA